MVSEKETNSEHLSLQLVCLIDGCAPFHFHTFHPFFHFSLFSRYGVDLPFEYFHFLQSCFQCSLFLAPFPIQAPPQLVYLRGNMSLRNNNQARIFLLQSIKSLTSASCSFFFRRTISKLSSNSLFSFFCGARVTAREQEQQS